MKKIALIAALSLAIPLIFPAAAQEAKPPAQPPKAEAPASAVQEKPKPVVKKSNPRRQEDARHCLEKASATEIIKCAEAYL